MALLLVLPLAAARAQAPADAPPPAAPPSAAPPPAAPPAPLPPAPPPGTPSAIEAATKPPTAAESMPASRPEKLPPIDVGAWVRAGSIFQSATDPKSLGGWHMDTSYIELHTGGKIHEKVGVTLNLNANLLPPFTLPGNGQGIAAIEDAIISFDFTEPFHLWAGQLLVPVDRANSAGPFFQIPWNYPGVFAVGGNAVIAIPKEGPSGRNTGAVVWGDFNGGQFKYLAGVFDNGTPAGSPLWSARLNLAIIGKEPGFWGNASYFGDADVLAVTLGGQYQKNGSSTPTAQKNYGEVNAELFGEFKLGSGAWVTGQGAYYHFVVSDTAPGSAKDSFFILASYASPVVGVGNIQPQFRFQWANTVPVAGGSTSAAINVEPAVSYLIKGPALRLIATYKYTKIPDATGASISANSIQLGAQGIFF